MLLDIYKSTFRTEGCSCCSARFAFKREGEYAYDSTHHLISREELEKHIAEMEDTVKQLREILDTHRLPATEAESRRIFEIEERET